MTARKPYCVCISGQARSFHEPIRALKALFPAHETTFIVSTWRKRGRKSSGPMFGWQLGRLLPSPVLDHMPEHLMGDALFQKIPALRELLADLDEQAEDVREDEFRDVLPGVVVDIQDDAAFLWPFESRQAENAYRMFYKMRRANNLRRAIEHANGATHGAVIRVRPDMLVRRLDVEATLTAFNTVGVPWIRGPAGRFEVDDALAVMRPDTATALADIDETLAAFPPRNEERKWPGAHQILGRHIRMHGLSPALAVGEMHLQSEQISEADFLRSVDRSLQDV